MDSPKFELGKSRHNLNTYLGRFYHNIDIIDPRTLFVSEKRLNESIGLLEQFKSGTLPSNVSNGQLWEAQKIKQSIVHPDTGEKILMPFRMSGYVPFNAPVVAGLLLPNPTLGQIIFWQWLNQSHNACVNYANKNASKPAPISKFLQGYGAAVTAAISISVGLNLLMRRANAFTPAVKSLIQRFIPLPAVATASTCNVVLMRLNELDDGISVVNKDGHTIGTSKVAAKKALKEMAITRAFLPLPLLGIPPIIMTMFEKTLVLKRNPKLHMPINLIVCTLCFFIALPASIAIFPQMSQVKTCELESEIQNRTRDEILFYNKGL